jgi:hypothetical protein
MKAISSSETTVDFYWIQFFMVRLSIYLSIYISIDRSTVLLSGLGRFFSFLILYTVGRTPWTEDQPVARQLPKHRTTRTQTKRTQTPIPRMGFEPTMLAFEDSSCLRPAMSNWRPTVWFTPAPAKSQVWFDWWQFQYLLNIIGAT